MLFIIRVKVCILMEVLTLGRCEVRCRVAKVGYLVLVMGMAELEVPACLDRESPSGQVGGDRG